MVLDALLLVSVFGPAVGSVMYIPHSWKNVCIENVSTYSPPDLTNSSSVVYVDLKCSISNSPMFHWRLNDLRDWTIQNKINYQTTPSNRTTMYNISVTCTQGANISLPWPMRVPGLIELHVTYCRLVDRYININYTADVSDDMQVLEIRHSFWLGYNNNRLIKNLNLSDDIDCGQDSSLRVLITSNTSEAVINAANFENKDDNNSVQGNQKWQAKSQANFSNMTSNNTIKPEDRLNKDQKTSVSDITVLSDVQSLLADANIKFDPKKVKEAHTDYVKLLNVLTNNRNNCNYTKLTVIDESYTPMTSEDHFNMMVQGSTFMKLEVMNYSHIGLRNLPDKLLGWRIYFPRLKYLDVSKNAISKIEVRNFPAIEKDVGTVTFDLRRNNITSISMDNLNSWAAVDKFFIDIRENPIHCGCQLSSFINYLEKNPNFTGPLEQYNYVRNLQCYTPKSLAGKRLSELQNADLPCPNYDSDNTSVIALGIFMGVLVITILIIIRFKIEIRILLYTRLHIRLPWDADAQRTNKMFDAFVSYSNEDSDWVFENIVKFLEKTANRSSGLHGNVKHSRISDINSNHLSFRLCIHQRDFIPGKTIFDNIVDSIEASRHTIIVLSPSFMRSHWAMEELRQAYRQSLVEKMRHLIVILLEKVSKEEMDPLINRCCKTFTYLEVNDSLFKDRLVFSLTTKDRSAKRRDRLVAEKGKSQKSPGQTEITVEENVNTPNVYSNQAFTEWSSRPPETRREFSNMSTSSVSALTSDC